VLRIVGLVGSLAIGDVLTNAQGEWRVVVIDPEINSLEAEDSAGHVVCDSIDHFVTSHDRKNG